MEERVKQEREAIQNLELDAKLWKTLIGLPNEDVCQRCLTPYDPLLQCYHVPVLNESYQVFTREMTIRKPHDLNFIGTFQRQGFFSNDMRT